MFSAVDDIMQRQPARRDISEVPWPAKKSNFAEIIENLGEVEASLQALIDESQSGKYGYITREWGFATPNGLGPRLGGKFQPWEDKLDGVPKFFWPVGAYQYMENGGDQCPHRGGMSLPAQSEKLPGNEALHHFLMEPPRTPVELTDEDFSDFRTASRIFILLGTLSHLCGNSIRGGPLPEWIEDPLRQVAKRLDVEPSLTGHFLTTENWIWRTTAETGNGLAALLNESELGDSSRTEEHFQKMIKTLLSKVEVKDRRYRMKVYKKCFIASQAIDVLVDAGFAGSRVEAVRLGRKVNERYDLFEHVVGDHLLKDDYLFFRFRPKRNKQGTAFQPADELAMSDHASRQEELKEKETSQMIYAISVMRSVMVQDRRYRLKTYKKCFVGRQLIDVLVQNGCSKSRQEALRLGRKLNERYNLFEHVCDSHLLEDAYLFYRFTGLKTETKIENDVSPYGRKIESFKRTDRIDGFGREEREFRFDHIEMLYPAFGNNHERVNQLIPACMAYQLRTLPFTVLDVISTMRSVIEAQEAGLKEDKDDRSTVGSAVQENIQHLSGLLYQVAFDLSRCKEQFQLMSTDPSKRTFNSKHISIRQTQPLANGVLVRREKNGEPLPCKGTSGVQFPYFHLLDRLLGRYHFGEVGLIATMGDINNYYPKHQREYIRQLGQLHKSSTVRGFLDVIGRPAQLMPAYNHLIECYAGEGGVLTAHCRKLYSYMHNDLQFSTSGMAFARGGTVTGAMPAMTKRKGNHVFAKRMFEAMSKATDERWRLRVAPLMTEVKKSVYSTSESGGFTTVALDLANKGLRYEYGDVVRVLLPNDTRTTMAWIQSLRDKDSEGSTFVKLEDMPASGTKGWTWSNLWEALGWSFHAKVPLENVACYIEQAQVRDDAGKMQWVNSPLDLYCHTDKIFAVPCAISRKRLASLVPVSPRIYSVSGVESERVFLMVSKPHDKGRHHGYERMADPNVQRVHCSFSPATFFLVPPVQANLVCVASGTGISPFVGLVDAIGPRQGNYTIIHQCKSSDLFLCNSQQWLDFTACNPGAMVMGYISGDKSRRNCPMRYVIRNGNFDQTSVLDYFNSSAYYFECPRFLSRLKEIYRTGGVNLAYCCGGVQSAIKPLRNIIEEHGWVYELTVESYAVSTSLSSKDFSCLIGGAIVDLDAVSPVHTGGDQILHEIQRIALDEEEQSGSKDLENFVPDHSDIFWQLHPNAYNLHRCLRAPFDAEFEQFSAFLARQAVSKRTVALAAEKYAKVALASPESSKVARIASELTSCAMRRQLSSGDKKGAQKSAEYLESLLRIIPCEDEQYEDWNDSLNEFHGSSQELDTRYLP